MEDWMKIVIIVVCVGVVGLLALLIAITTYKPAQRPTRGFFDRERKSSVQAGGVFVVHVASGGHGFLQHEGHKPNEPKTGESVDDLELWNDEAEGGTFTIPNVKKSCRKRVSVSEYGFNGREVEFIFPEWNLLKELIPYASSNMNEKLESENVRLRQEVRRLTNENRTYLDNQSYAEAQKRLDRQSRPMMPSQSQQGGLTLVQRAAQQQQAAPSEVKP